MRPTQSTSISLPGFTDLVFKIILKYQVLQVQNQGQNVDIRSIRDRLLKDLEDVQQDWQKYFLNKRDAVGSFMGIVFDKSNADIYKNKGDNLRGCIYQYYLSNHPERLSELGKGDNYARKLWENIKELTDAGNKKVPIVISKKRLAVYERFIDDDEQWQDFLQKTLTPSPLTDEPEITSQWHSFHCFFSGEDSPEVQSFFLLVDIHTHQVKIPWSPQQSQFEGLLTVGGSGHYVCADLQSDKHKRPLRMLFKKRSTENSIEEQELMLGIYMFVNKDEEAIHRGFLILTCNQTEAKAEAKKLLAQTPETIGFPKVPEHIKWSLKNPADNFNFKDDTVAAIQHKYALSVKFPTVSENKKTESTIPFDPIHPSFYNTYWRLSMREPDNISELLLHIFDTKSGDLNICELLIFENEYEEYSGTVGLDKTGLWMVFNLSTKESFQKNVHIKIGIPPAAKEPTLLIGQINYIRTSKPSVVRTDTILLEKIKSKVKKLDQYVFNRTLI